MSRSHAREWRAKGFFMDNLPKEELKRGAED